MDSSTTKSDTTERLAESTSEKPRGNYEIGGYTVLPDVTKTKVPKVIMIILSSLTTPVCSFS